eukprot:591437-Amphidinium_carterae.1
MADEAKASLREKRHELWRGIRALCQKGCESPQDSIVDKMKKRLQEVRELQHHWWQNITDTWRQGTKQSAQDTMTSFTHSDPLSPSWA